MIYPVFYMAHLLGRDLCERIIRFPENLGIMEFCFTHLTDVGNPYTVEDYVTGMIMDGFEETRQEIRELVTPGREAAEICVEETAKRIIGMGAKVLAGSSIFSQQNATLAIMRRVKELDPSVKTIIGGSNVRDRAGMAVLRHYPSVDYVFFGEGDEVFDEVCRRLIDGDGDSMPYGVVSRNEASSGSIPGRMTKDMNRVPYPDYSDFIEEWERERSGYYGESILIGRDGVTPFLEGEFLIYMEGSRGCWWGEKHPCTFCGLNGEKNIYRSKTPERIYEEIHALESRYPGHYIQFTDNIMSMEAVHRLLPMLEADPGDHKLLAEVKTNLREEEIRNLVRAGFIKVQPGIESLNDHLLTLMGKGNTAVNHVAFLKYSRYYGLKLTWNLLYAIPGEEEADYRELMELLPKLYHYTPPSGPYEILFQRFSKYDEAPEKYGLILAPYKIYQYYYGDNADRINNMFLYYMPVGGSFMEVKARHRGLYKTLLRLAEDWRKLHQREGFHGLTMRDSGDSIFIVDARPCMKVPFMLLTGAACEIYRLAWSPVSGDRIRAALKERYTEQEIEAAAAMLLDRNLMVFLSGLYLALALPSD